MHTIDRTNEAIAAGINAGDEALLAELYQTHAPRVTAVAMSVLRDRDLAADITQDVFTRLWRNPDRYRPDRGPIGAFLAVDAKGRSIDLLRSRKAELARERKDNLMRGAEHKASTEDTAIVAVVGDSVRESLGLLPDDQRIPIELAFFGDLSYRSVAERLSLPEGTVKTRIRTGLRALRNNVSEELVAA